MYYKRDGELSLRDGVGAYTKMKGSCSSLRPSHCNGPLLIHKVNERHTMSFNLFTQRYLPPLVKNHPCKKVTQLTPSKKLKEEKPNFYQPTL